MGAERCLSCRATIGDWPLTGRVPGGGLFQGLRVCVPGTLAALAAPAAVGLFSLSYLLRRRKGLLPPKTGLVCGEGGGCLVWEGEERGRGNCDCCCCGKSGEGIEGEIEVKAEIGEVAEAGAGAGAGSVFTGDLFVGDIFSLN